MADWISGNVIIGGSTSKSIHVELQNLDGSAKTDAAFGDVTATYLRPGGTVTTITLAALGAVDSAWSSGGWVHIGNGVYRLDIPNAAIATISGGGNVLLMLSCADCVPFNTDYSINAGNASTVADQVTALNNLDSTAVQSAAAAAIGAYDPPTRAEATADKDEVLAAVATVDTVVDGIKASTDNLPASPAATGDIPSAASIRSEIDSNSTQLAAIVEDTGTTIPASIAALNDYDGSDTPGVTTLLSRIASALTITGGKVTVGTNDDKTGYALTSGERDAVAVAVESHLLDEGDSQQLINAIVTAIGNSNVDETALVAAIRADLERAGGHLAEILADTGTTVPGLIAALNDLDSSEIQSAAAAALAAYDPPTRTEATADKDAVIAAVGTVDGKVDSILEDTGTTLPATLATIAGYIDTEVAAIKAATDNLPADPATETTLAVLDSLLDAIKAVTDKLDTGLEADGSGGFQFTVLAVENAPSGSGASASAIADAVWTEALGDHSGVTGSAAEQLAAAGASGDPWATQLPGAYGEGSAGKIVGDNLNATVGSRSSHTAADVWSVATRALTAFSFTVNTNANATETAIKERTDNLPDTPAAAGDAMTLTSGERDAVAVVVESHLLDEGDSQLLINAIVTAIGNSNVDETALVAAIRADLERSGGHLAEILTDSGTTLPASLSGLSTALSTVDTVVDAIKVIADKLDSALELDSSVYRFTANALEQGPVGSATAANQASILAALSALNDLDSAAAQAAVAAALAAYDPPTRAEATADKNAVLAAVTTVDTVVDGIASAVTTVDTVVDGIATEVAKVPRRGQTFRHRNTDTDVAATVIIENPT